MAFDRLIRAVDQWSAARGRQDVFAQIGPASYEPRHIRWVRFLEPLEFRARVSEASVVVAHAGMGSIITALELGKPILVMPRRGDLRETRNDHQVDTARHFLAQGRIAVAFDERELGQKLEELDGLTAAAPVTPQASPELLRTLRRFVDRGVVSCPQTRFDGLVTLGQGCGERLFNRLPALQVEMNGRGAVRGGPVAWALRLASGRALGRGPRLRMRSGGQATLALTRIARQRRSLDRAAGQVRKAMRQLGIRLPLLWVAEPIAAGLVEQIPHAALVYHRRGAVSHEVGSAADDQWLKAHADLTLFSSFASFEVESGGCHRPQLLADFEQRTPVVLAAAGFPQPVAKLYAGDQPVATAPIQPLDAAELVLT